MEDNNILISVSLTLSILFNILSWIITIDMKDNDNPDLCNCAKNCQLFVNEWFLPVGYNKKITFGQKALAVITLMIGLVALATWGASLGLDSHVGLTNSNPNTQTLYALGTIGVIFDSIWMLATFKYWCNRNR
jgi:cation transport ATPase